MPEKVNDYKIKVLLENTTCKSGDCQINLHDLYFSKIIRKPLQL